jgi:spore coat protein U-like protein
MRLPPLLLLAAVLAAMPPAFGGSASTTLAVSATVIDVCGVAANPTLPFGSYDPTSPTPVTANTDVIVTCTIGTVYTVSLDGGGSGDTAARQMAKGADRLNYQLYKDIGLSLVFGDAGLLQLAGLGTGAAISHKVYGIVAAGQAAPVGNYTDTVNVTIDY